MYFRSYSPVVLSLRRKITIVRKPFRIWTSVRLLCGAVCRMVALASHKTSTELQSPISERILVWSARMRLTVRASKEFNAEESIPLGRIQLPENLCVANPNSPNRRGVGML